MIKRGPFTIVLITRQRLIRADFGGGRVPQIKERFECPRPDVDDLATLVDSALQLGPTKVKNVLVLCSDLWSSVLSVSSEVILRVSDRDLGEMLAFEAEPFSGITAFDASVGFTELTPNSTERRFWTTVAQSVDREYVATVVEQYGGILCGLAHPAGLPRSLAIGGSESWERVEFWEDAVVCVRPSRSNDNRCDLRIISANPITGSYDEEVSQWRDEAPQSKREILTSNADYFIDESDADSVVDLSADSGLESWLIAWASVLRQPKSVAPIVVPDKKPMSARTRSIISFTAAACVALVCFVVYQSNQQRLSDLETQIEQLAKPKKELDKIRAEFTTLDKQLDEVRTRTSKLKADVAIGDGVLQAYRDRLPILLGILSEYSGERVLIEEITATTDETVISGISLDAVSMHQLAEAMSAPAKVAGWEVLAPEKEVTASPAGLPIWTFRMKLKDRAPVYPRQPNAAIALQK